MFLTNEEIAELTGIGRGRDGKTRGELQAAWLMKMGFPVIVNARGEPKLARSIIDGSNVKSKPTKGWTPNVLR